MKLKAIKLIGQNHLKKSRFKDVLNQRYEDVCGEIECVLVGKCPYCKTWIVNEGEDWCPKCEQLLKWKE